MGDREHGKLGQSLDRVGPAFGNLLAFSMEKMARHCSARNVQCFKGKYPLGLFKDVMLT